MRLKLFIVSLLLLSLTSPLLAHANLAKSSPAANERLETAPSEIRLWFTEPLEPAYSRITLRDQNGQTVETPQSQVLGGDTYQMLLRPGELPNGIYTVTWRALSAADGHTTEGSFAFGVGAAVSGELAAPQVDEAVEVTSVIIRTLNLLSYSLLIGGVGFTLLVWMPYSEGSAVPPRLYRLLWVGWLAVGVSGVLMLFYQIGLQTGQSLSEVDLGGFLTGTTYGRLWLMRNSLWFFIGTALDMRQRPRLALPLVLFLSAALLLTHSLYSHGSAAEDAIAAVAGGWLHLFLSSLWIGGLIAFGLTLWRHEETPQNVGRLVAYFSNYARVGVIALIITGFYAGWLLVGSPDAMVNTIYGRSLFLKLILFLPLLALAGVNLIVVSRELRSGSTVWAKRLRQTIGGEVVLASLILIAASVMTSGIPARDVTIQRGAVPMLPDVEPYVEMQTAEEQTYHLEIEPGYVGENTFTVLPFDENGEPIEDVTRIRLRFDNLDQSLGQSEIRPEARGEGVYSATGANLSAPGKWRVRMTVSRPNTFDQVIDYEVDVQPPPLPVIPPIDDTLPLDQRWMMAGLAGVSLFGVGAVALIAQKPRLRNVLALALMVVGAIFAVSAITPFVRSNTPISVTNVRALPAGEGGTMAVYMRLQNPGIVADALVGGVSEVAESVELHESMVMEDVGHMMQQSALEIPAGGVLELEPDVYHLMLVNLNRDVEDGETFPLTLEFESGRTQTVEVRVGFDVE